MILPRISSISLALLFLTAAVFGYQQQTPQPPTDTAFDALTSNSVERIKTARTSPSPTGRVAAVVRGSTTLLLYSVTPITSRRSFLSEIEESRIDKQVGASASSPGSTSLVSSGSVPSLLGFAVENGGLTQTTNGSAITFRGNLAGLLKSFAKQDYLESAITEKSDWGSQAANKLSGSVSFDINRGSTPGTFTGQGNQISGYSFHYDLHNRRDPRNREYQVEWMRLRDDEQRDVANKLTTFRGELATPPDPAVCSGAKQPAAAESESQAARCAFDRWVETAAAALIAASESDIESVFKKQIDIFDQSVFPVLIRNPHIKQEYDAAIESLNNFAKARVAVVTKALKSLIVSSEYVEVRQNQQTAMAAAGASAATTSATQPLPELGTFRLIAAGRFIGQSEITANGSFTTFNRIPKGIITGKLRDWQTSLQVVTPLPDLFGIGKPTLTFAGQFVRLMAQPLGAKVSVNGQQVDSLGNIGYGQTKLEIPIKGTGIKLPISLTYATRRELLKNEKNVIGGNIGLTFDLDKIFAKPK